MNQDEVQEFSDQNSLDVRIMNTGKGGKPNHFRLMDEYGNYVADVYFKHTKAGALRPYNKVFNLKNKRWADIKNTNELKQFITK